MRDTILGLSITRTIMVWCLYYVPLFWECTRFGTGLWVCWRLGVFRVLRFGECVEFWNGAVGSRPRLPMCTPLR